ncbi:MAG: TetR/AcrR family transcriptional regulator [Myxococcales bacterium]|nr:TetR/AcrR family transcriptional regulator [Myxococcales bacterium]
MPPLERYFKLPETKRNQLLRAARKEFATHGFERASYNRIIAATEVSKGAMYYYFADKADLFGAVIDQLVADVIARVGPPPPAHDADGFWQSLGAWGMRAAELTFAEPDLSALGRCLYGDSGAQQVVDRVRQQLQAAVIETLEHGQTLGAVRDDVPTDMLATGLTHLLLGLDRWFADRLDDLSPADVEHLSLKTLELCRDLSAPPSVNRESP